MVSRVRSTGVVCAHLLRQAGGRVERGCGRRGRRQAGRRALKRHARAVDVVGRSERSGVGGVRHRHLPLLLTYYLLTYLLPPICLRREASLRIEEWGPRPLAPAAWSHAGDSGTRPPSHRRPSAPRTRPAPRRALRRPGWPAAPPRPFGRPRPAGVAAPTGGAAVPPSRRSLATRPAHTSARARARLARRAGTRAHGRAPGAWSEAVRAACWGDARAPPLLPRPTRTAVFPRCGRCAARPQTRPGCRSRPQPTCACLLWGKLAVPARLRRCALPPRVGRLSPRQPRVGPVSTGGWWPLAPTEVCAPAVRRGDTTGPR